MKFNINQTTLLQGLQAVQNIVGLHTTLPILANVRIACDKNGVSLTTTDLSVTIQCRVEAEVMKTGGTTLPARRLFNIVRELPNAMIHVEVDDKDVATLECDSSFFKIIGLSEDEFPPIGGGDGGYTYRIDQGLFRDMLRKTAYAASTDETRYVLTGVLLSFKGGKLTMVATDGRRLALVEQEIEVPKEAETEVIIPSRAVDELLRILGSEGELSIQVKDKQVAFQCDHILLVSKVIEGTYPNYRQVIPTQCEERITVDREALLIAIRRVSLIAPDGIVPMRLLFNKNKLVLTLSAPDIGEARETLPIKYTGKELTVAFNPLYMMDPLKNLTTDEVAIELTDDLSPGVIKCDLPFLYVLMPMRVS